MTEPPTSYPSCSLNGEQRQLRRRAWEDLLERAAISFRFTSTGVLVSLEADPAVEAELRKLAQQEAHCCGFADWQVKRRQGKLELEIVAPAEAASAVHQLFQPSATVEAHAC